MSERPPSALAWSHSNDRNGRKRPLDERGLENDHGDYVTVILSVVQQLFLISARQELAGARTNDSSAVAGRRRAIGHRLTVCLIADMIHLRERLSY
jgi:hypothetical protein